MTREELKKITSSSPFTKSGSYRLDELVRSIIADGEVTDKERAAVRRKAEELGEDPDMAEVYVDGIAQQVKQILLDEESKKNEKASSGFEHDLELFIKETSRSNEIEYYKFKKVYILDNLFPSKNGVKTIQIQFIDVVRRDDESIEERYKYLGLYLFVSLIAPRGKHYFRGNIQFISGKEQILSLESDWNRFQDQTINGKSATTTKPYKIDKEQLKVLCEVSDISIKTVDTSYDEDDIIIHPTQLKDFQKYARLFYHTIVDSNVYSDIEKEFDQNVINNEKKDVKKSKEQEIAFTLSGQQLAGLLSKKVSAKRITPVPHYMSQYRYNNIVITDVVSTATALKKDSFSRRDADQISASLHAIIVENRTPQFYLCLSSENNYYLKNRDLSLIVNTDSFELEPVTSDEAFFSSKWYKKKNGYYNFYALENNCVKQLIEKKAEFRLESSETDYGRKRKDIFECEIVPSGWRKTYEMLTNKGKLESWVKSTSQSTLGKFTAFLETYLHCSPLFQLLILISILLFLGMLFYCIIEI